MEQEWVLILIVVNCSPLSAAGWAELTWTPGGSSSAEAPRALLPPGGCSGPLTDGHFPTNSKILKKLFFMKIILFALCISFSSINQMRWCCKAWCDLMSHKFSLGNCVFTTFHASSCALVYYLIRWHCWVLPWNYMSSRSLPCTSWSAAHAGCASPWGLPPACSRIPAGGHCPAQPRETHGAASPPAVPVGEWMKMNK